MDFLVVQFLNGLASASSLFLVASGLSVVFGVTRVVNFAHGSLYMLGAYLAWTLVQPQGLGAGPAGFWGGLLLAALAIGACGVLVEVLLLRRIYGAPELFQLLATFGVALAVQDLVLMLWGPEDRLGPRAPGLAGAVPVLGQPFPAYDLLLIGLGPAVLGALWLLFRRTRWGTLVRAATEDREIVAALGVDQARLFTGVLALGAALAGFGGALQLPREAVHHAMDLQIIAEAFVVVVLGGMGSVPGAYLAAVVISELHAFGIVVFPEITLVLVFLVMAVVLIVRPWGLLGRPEALGQGRAAMAEPPLRPLPGRQRLAAAAAGALLLAAPAVLGDYALGVLAEILIFALFAASLHFIMGPGGLLSFGHAAYFGLGAYGSALAVTSLALPMEAALAAALLLAGAGALLYGWFAVRLAGVYLAMLTLAFAQISYAVAVQWYRVTGGDNGILGVWPAPWAAGATPFYYLTLLLCGGGILALRHVVFAPFGYTLRAGRDSPLRADAIGIDVRRHRWLAFALAGLGAGLSGGLHAFLKGSVFPAVLSIPVSIDGLVMVLLGGVQTLSGPLVGAAVYKAAQIVLAGVTDYWRLVVGGLVVGLVLAFPRGIVGSLRALAAADPAPGADAAPGRSRRAPRRGGQAAGTPAGAGASVALERAESREREARRDPAPEGRSIPGPEFRPGKAEPRSDRPAPPAPRAAQAPPPRPSRLPGREGTFGEGGDPEHPGPSGPDARGRWSLAGRARPARAAGAEPAGPGPAARSSLEEPAAPLLSVRDLHKAFGGIVAVKDVGFDLRAGEVVALIGPNGAGKTTCFNILGGQLAPDAGSVRLNGRELVGLPPREIWRLGVGRTFQVTETFGSMTVRENVQMAFLSRHRRLRALVPVAARFCADEATALLERVGMADQAERACGVLAYGDLKRVELAVALAHDPVLLLMDEPTAGMAPRERIELMALVASIVEERRIGVLFTEHDMDVVFAHAGRILVMDRGELIAEGRPAEVRRDPRVRAIYLGASPPPGDGRSGGDGDA